MNKLYLFMMVSLDGFFEGEKHDLSWHNVDAEFNEFAVKQLDETGTLVFGRRTYDLMADFWPSSTALQADPETATRMSSLKKIVFSRTLESADWVNTELHQGNVPAVISDLKHDSRGKDIGVLGSSDLSRTLIQEKLLDELRIMVNPVVLGNGTRLFAGIEHELKSTLLNSRQFESGNVLLTYKPRY
jgi:dihydrofolate reductase